MMLVVIFCWKKIIAGEVDVVRLVECLPRMYEALVLIPRTV